MRSKAGTTVVCGMVILAMNLLAGCNISGYKGYTGLTAVGTPTDTPTPDLFAGADQQAMGMACTKASKTPPQADSGSGASAARPFFVVYSSSPSDIGSWTPATTYLTAREQMPLLKDAGTLACISTSRGGIVAQYCCNTTSPGPVYGYATVWDVWLLNWPTTTPIDSHEFVNNSVPATCGAPCSSVDASPPIDAFWTWLTGNP